MLTIRKKLYQIVFESDTRAGRIFDELLLGIILLSILLVILESVSGIRAQYLNELRVLEWVITGIFTIEYFVRIWIVDRPVKYILSFYGIIDLCALLPAFLAFFWVGSHTLIVIRAFRLLRVFRILKLGRYTKAGRMLSASLWNSREKISVFFIFIIALSVFIGTMMYLVEGEENGFKDIPTSIYWAIVTLTTVGYGDLSPTTGLGQFLASIVMIMGYAIIAVPTGIVTSAIMNHCQEQLNTQVCPNCLFDKHDDDAVFCKKCGSKL